jgi:hypothetical protein
MSVLTLAPWSRPVMHRRPLAYITSCTLFCNRLRVTSAKLQQLQPRLRVVAGLAGSVAPRRQSRMSRRSRLQTASSARRRSSTCGSWSTSRRRPLTSVSLLFVVCLALKGPIHGYVPAAEGAL